MVAFCVLKLFKFKEVNIEHPENIEPILVTGESLKLYKSIKVRSGEALQNHPLQRNI